MLTTYLFRYILQNAPFRSQIFFASGGKGAETPVTKIPRTFLVSASDCDVTVRDDQGSNLTAAGTRFSDPEGTQGWVDLGTAVRRSPCPRMYIATGAQPIMGETTRSKIAYVQG